MSQRLNIGATASWLDDLPRHTTTVLIRRFHLPTCDDLRYTAPPCVIMLCCPGSIPVLDLAKLMSLSQPALMYVQSTLLRCVQPRASLTDNYTMNRTN